jgi:2-hydroxychromene-2-carboxylate isomerase
MPARAIDFVFDFISPFAYIAWHQMQAVCARHGCALRPVPVLFAALLDAHGTKGPAEIPAKRVYVFKDAFRKAHRAGLPPLTPPPSHPFNPLLALRAVTSVENADERAKLITALFHATWADGSGVDTPDKVERIASGAGLDGAALVRAAQTAEVKEALKRATAEALSRGAFGVPTMLVDGELFWGCDSVDALEDFVMGRDPIQGVSLERWASLPASAKRPGS